MTYHPIVLSLETVNFPEKLPLKPQQRKALAEAKEKITQRFPVESILLFGSAVRGELGPESDIDLLILTTRSLDRRLRHEITDLIFEINLRYAANLSTVVVDRHSWETGLVSALPFHERIEAEGVEL
ncbi:nucleotidyltransferase domain-containing protein [Acidobacteria bacterium AH-259-O06]|nr:nucleotidyltransferase domain-containing protein [Acidobacteria bacterium AH-259-O06]